MLLKSVTSTFTYLKGINGTSGESFQNKRHKPGRVELFPIESLGCEGYWPEFQATRKLSISRVLPTYAATATRQPFLTDVTGNKVFASTMAR
jgi:hypothetical protein